MIAGTDCEAGPWGLHGVRSHRAGPRRQRDSPYRLQKEPGRYIRDRDGQVRGPRVLGIEELWYALDAGELQARQEQREAAQLLRMPFGRGEYEVVPSPRRRHVEKPPRLGLPPPCLPVGDHAVEYALPLFLSAA